MRFLKRVGGINTRFEVNCHGFRVGNDYRCCAEGSTVYNLLAALMQLRHLLQNVSSSVLASSWWHFLLVVLVAAPLLSVGFTSWQK